MVNYSFEWDTAKALSNLLKHGVNFEEAREIFKDPYVVHLKDELHSDSEERHYAVGKTLSGRIITVRYTLREEAIRIIGAAEWRRWRKYYYEQNSQSLQNEAHQGPDFDEEAIWAR